MRRRNARRIDAAGAGARADAFDEWARDASLTETELRAVLERGLLEDFYWNQSAEDVRYRAPAVPADLTADRVELDEDDIEGELDSLGPTVSEVLETDYILRDGTEFGYSWE